MTHLDKLPKKQEEVRDRAPTLGKVERHPHRRAVVGGILGTVALSSGLLGYNLLGRGEDTNAAPNPETTTSAEYDDSDQPDAQESAGTPESGVLYPPEREYPRPTVEQARVDPAELNSMADAPEAFTAKLSEWLMAGTTIDNYNQYMQDNPDIYEFSAQIAHENRLIYQEALFGITGDPEDYYGDNKALCDWIEEQNATAIARFLTSVDNEWVPEITEAYHGQFTIEAVTDYDEKLSLISHAEWVVRFESNDDNAIAPDRGYQKPADGNGTRWTIEADMWVTDVEGEPAYGDQFGENAPEQGKIRFDTTSITSTAANV